MPSWLAILSAIITLILAILTTSFIWRQVRLEKTRIKMEAYDRRLNIYNAIKKYIAEIQTYGTTTDAKSVAFLQETREALFLFKNKIISEHINMLYKKGVDLEYLETQLRDSGDYLNQAQRGKIAHQAKELKQWFGDQHKVIEELFDEYLRLS